jgi:phosphoenolpyruvate phosphomutase
VVNEDWASGSELGSLACAAEALTDDTILLYGDLLFRTYILNNLMDWDADLQVVVDSSPLAEAVGNKNDLAWCSAPDDRAMYQQKVTLERISSESAWQGRRPDGRWIGMLRVRGPGRGYLLEALEQLRGEPGFERMDVPDLVNRLIDNGHAPQVQYISGHWMDINNLDDLQRAGEFAHGQAS